MDDHTDLQPEVETPQIPRDLIEQTLMVLIRLPAHEVYPLIKRWEAAVPGVIQGA